MLGADLDRELPDPGVVEIAAQQDDAGAAGKPGPGAAVRGVGADDNERRTGPGSPGTRRIRCDFELDAGCRGQSQQIVQDVGVSGDEHRRSIDIGRLRKAGAPVLAPDQRAPQLVRVTEPPPTCGQCFNLWTTQGPAQEDRSGG